MIFLVSGCASGARFSSVEPTPTNKSAIYFYRPAEYVGAAIRFSVLDNGKEALAIKNGQFIRYETTPGKHKFVTDTSMIDKELNINLDPGETYYIKVGLDTGMWTSTVRLNKLYPDQATEEMKSCCRSGGKELEKSAPPPDKKSRQKNSSGQDLVKKIQQGLVRLGYDPGPVDGVYGNKTKTAIEALQRDSGTVPDGEATHEVLDFIEQRGK